MMTKEQRMKYLGFMDGTTAFFRLSMGGFKYKLSGAPIDGIAKWEVSYITKEVIGTFEMPIDISREEALSKFHDDSQERTTIHI